MKLHKFSSIVLLGCTLLLNACGTSNKVQRQVGKDAVTEQFTEGEHQGLYRNLYRTPVELRHYPANCKSDCYPAHQAVKCKTPGQNCRYTAVQQAPALNSGFAVQWLGHASFLVHTPDNQQLLFDPVFGQFDWPVRWVQWFAGIIKRPYTPTISSTTLAETDAVLYSHLHYDHFSQESIQQIGNKPTYYLPLGMAEYMPQGGYNIIEHAWYSQSQQGELNIHLVPAHHFNNRRLFNDDNKAMWGGWLLEHNGKTLFFAGDTGYSKHFNDIQQKYGNIDICLLPIASYHHEEHADWYRYVHTTPEDALVAAKELGCKVMIPWGYGNASWQMGDISSHSPLLRLLHMQQQLKSQVPLMILNEGESVQL